MMPLVVPFSDGYMDLIFEGPVKAHLVVIAEAADKQQATSSSSSSSSYFVGVSDDALEEAALATRGEVLYILLPATDDEGSLGLRRFFGLKDDGP